MVCQTRLSLLHASASGWVASEPSGVLERGIESFVGGHLSDFGARIQSSEFELADWYLREVDEVIWLPAADGRLKILTHPRRLQTSLLEAGNTWPW